MFFLSKITALMDFKLRGKKEIKKMATAVSANWATFQRAAEIGVDALIVHHGLFWDRDPYPIVRGKKAKIELLLKHQINLFAYHLPLDAHREVGNNWQAARDLGWVELEPFGEYLGTLIGVKGKFAPQPIEKCVANIENYYEHHATVALGGKPTVASGALISGGAYKELAYAVTTGVDCYITGNFDEPAWSMAHEGKVHFLALGHSATERVGPKALAAYLEQRFGLPCPFIDITNPF